MYFIRCLIFSQEERLEEVITYLHQGRLGVTANALRKKVQIIGEFRITGFGFYFFLLVS